jgi:23S rRNA pseudouridine1911/1915/1917 synthase
LVKAHPSTGRTHQIRVHLASLGYPIVGDKIYGPDENLYLRFIETGWTDELAGRLLLERHALHASRLCIDEQRDWSSPLPRDLADWML